MKKLLIGLLLFLPCIVLARPQSSYTVYSTTSGLFQVYKGTFVWTDTLDAFPSSATYNQKVKIDSDGVWINGILLSTSTGNGGIASHVYDIGTSTINTLNVGYLNVSSTSNPTSRITMGGVILTTSSANGGELLVNGSPITGSGSGSNTFTMLTDTPTEANISTGTFAVTQFSTSSFKLWANYNGYIIGMPFITIISSPTGGGVPGGLGSCQNWWRFLDGSGTTAIDSKGSLNLTLDAPCTWFVDGAGIYIPSGYQAKAASGLNEAGDWSWYQSVRIGGPFYYVSCGSPRQYEPDISGTNPFMIWGGSSLTGGIKHNIVYVYSSATTSFRIYVDGSLNKDWTNWGAYVFSNGAVEYGRPGAVFGFNNSYVKDFHLYEGAFFNSALSLSDITTHGMGAP